MILVSLGVDPRVFQCFVFSEFIPGVPIFQDETFASAMPPPYGLLPYNCKFFQLTPLTFESPIPLALEVSFGATTPSTSDAMGNVPQALFFKHLQTCLHRQRSKHQQEAAKSNAEVSTAHGLARDASRLKDICGE